MATTYPAVISTTSLDGMNGFTVLRNANNYADSDEVTPLGDINGDGFNDLVITLQSWERDGVNAGYSYVLFGKSSGFPPSFMLPSVKNNADAGFAITNASVDYVQPIFSAGDINGDGLDDFAIGAAQYYDRSSYSWMSGSLSVIFGRRDGFGATLSIADLKLDGKNGFQIDGNGIGTEYSQDNGFGRIVAPAGDVNGDGYDDLILGADRTKTGPGSAFVVYGKKSGFAGRIEVTDLDGSDGFRINGSYDLDDRAFAQDVAGAGDVNGDGADDVIVEGGKASYVVFGQKTGVAASFDLKNLNGRNGFAIKGQDKNGSGNPSLVQAGDLNGDGIGDLVAWRNPWPQSDEGEATLYVVFGKKSGFSATIDLDGLNGSDGFKILGGPFTDLTMSRLGDFNGDGIDDLAIGSGVSTSVDTDDAVYGVHLWSNFKSDNAFIVFGKKDGFGKFLTLADLDGANGLRITGHDKEIAGISSAGDINGDGAADLVLGIGMANSDDRPMPTSVIYGKMPFQGVTRDGSPLGETLTGTINGDVLSGREGDDRLIGLAGDDRLNGGTGADRMEGGAGNDVYFVDDVRDLTIEAAGQGTDTVIASISYTLAAGMELETLRPADLHGRANLNFTGNKYFNSIYGNAGNNLLNGGGGFDSLGGGAGNDTYVVEASTEAGTPSIYEDRDDGEDRVLASTNYGLMSGTHVETMQLLRSTKMASLNLSGNEYAQVIRGNDGRNVLDGCKAPFVTSLEADSLYGGRGGDVYVVRRSDDKVFELVGQGHDTVTTDVTYTLAAGQEIESLQFRSFHGKADLDLTGNEFANTIYGNAGDNVLDGRLGADVLSGRLGADSFAFSTKLGAGNIDRIVDFDAQDTIRLSKAIFAGLTPGQLAAGAFKDPGVAGAKLEAEDRIVYDSRTGALAFDADGSGAEAAVQFATLANRAALTAADFLIV